VPLTHSYQETQWYRIVLLPIGSRNCFTIPFKQMGKLSPEDTQGPTKKVGEMGFDLRSVIFNPWLPPLWKQHPCYSECDL